MLSSIKNFKPSTDLFLEVNKSDMHCYCTETNLSPSQNFVTSSHRQNKERKELRDLSDS